MNLWIKFQISWKLSTKILRYTENENNWNFKKISSTTEDEQMNDFDEKQTQFNDRKITKLTMLWYQQMDDKHKENTAITKTNKPWYHRE